MRILIVHQYYLMPGQPGGSRFNEMARLWADLGHEITVIAGTVDYISGKAPERYHGRWVSRENDGAVRVYRCHVPASYATSYLGRMWAFLGFTLSASTAALCAPRPDIVIATSPPLVATIPGWIAARVTRHSVPWIFEVRDLWPESAVTTGVLKAGSLLTHLLFGLERWACGSASKINVLTPAFQADMEKRGLAAQTKFCCVPNGADLDSFQPGERDNEMRKQLGWGDRFVVMYAGAHGRANALRQLVDAAAELRDRPDILIACVGDGPERQRLAGEAERRGLENIRFHGAKPKASMPDIVNACDAGAAVLQNNPTFRTVYPNKVFDYMSCARPVLLAIDGAARTLVCDEAKAGVFAEPENPKAIASAIRSLADYPGTRAEMAANGRRWVLANASRGALAERYLDVLMDLAPGGRSSVLRQRRSPVLKNIIDRSLATAGLVILSPIILALACLIRVRLGRPVLFRQTRIGRGEKPFLFLKFRTMTDSRDSHGIILPDEQRLTVLGRFLRTSSLDELPQLWNVLKGEMSLVGPRPLLPEYLPRYNAHQCRRHEVKPGITGWVQVNGRNALTWEEKFDLDLKILLRTLFKVLQRDGISQLGHATMPEFTGTVGITRQHE
jgi:lipopolysaccharide/colanic/teichoic acid biosynthesis glycosyltransferase/UDP-N-acetylglucosamine:LPS N-acetylglucosamine transferase